jgi:hypothetical protein
MKARLAAELSEVRFMTHIAIQANKRRPFAYFLSLLTIIVLGSFSLFVYRNACWPLIDGHPRQLGTVEPMEYGGATEADFETAFGCRGRLVSGNRTPGTAYIVEWSDDTNCLLVSFGADGKWVGISRYPFFGSGGSYIHTPYERFLLALRRMGLNIR